jgi:hypothetical protein
MSSGVSAIVHTAVWFETDLGLEVLSIGRSTEADENCALETCGKWLAYHIALRGPEVRLAATLMDAVSAPETLLRTSDDETGWQTVKRLVTALEHNGIKTLARPIEIGEPGNADSWVIG